MNETRLNTEPKKRRKWVFLLKFLISSLLLIALLVFLISLFATEESVYSLNAFLAKGYVPFLLLRLVIYGGVIMMCLKMKSKIKPTPYYTSFVRTGCACIAFVILNEVMLYIRLVG